MTKQEIVNEIFKWFTQPGAVLGSEPVSEDGMTCVYRGEGDPTSKVRCGIGCLIPDDVYDPTYEGSAVSHLVFEPTVIRHDELIAVIGDQNVGFLCEIQNAHDDSTDVGEFLTQLGEIARQHELVVPRAA